MERARAEHSRLSAVESPFCLSKGFANVGCDAVRLMATALNNLASLLYQTRQYGAGQQKRAKFPTSKAHISAVFHSFRLIFGRAIISLGTVSKLSLIHI